MENTILSSVGLVPMIFLSFLCLFPLTKTSVPAFMEEDQRYKLIHFRAKQTSKHKPALGTAQPLVTCCFSVSRGQLSVDPILSGI